MHRDGKVELGLVQWANLGAEETTSEDMNYLQGQLPGFPLRTRKFLKQGELFKPWQKKYGKILRFITGKERNLKLHRELAARSEVFRT